MQRLTSLDGLRGLLAVYVLLGHMAPFAALPAWIQTAVSHGGAAVDVFFMLSGLVITQSLRSAGGLARPFLIARTVRIFPVFLAAFALAVTLEPTSCGFQHMPWISPTNTAHAICGSFWPDTWAPEIAAHLTMTHGLFPNALLPHVWVSFLGSAWSLSTEWQFYILALLIGSRGERLCRILLALALAGLVWQWTGPQDWQFSRAFLPNKGHFFALGVASVAVVRTEPGAIRRYALMLAATVAVCAAGGTPGKLLPPLIWTACLWVQMHPACLPARFLSSRRMGYLGAISYCLYLINEPVHKMLGQPLGWLAGGNAATFALLWIPLAIGLPIVAAAALHRYLEVPAQRWGQAIAQRSVAARDSKSVQRRSLGL